MSENSKVKALLGARCPKCHKGKLFPVSVMSFRKLSVVNKKCSVCGTSFHSEPDFYYGAMYISYAFSVAILIIVLTSINVLIAKPELWMYLTSMVIGNIVLMPLMLRYSKVIYLNLMGK